MTTKEIKSLPIEQKIQIMEDEVILEQAAMRLPARARALLADALLGSLDDKAAHAIEVAWGREADARLEAYRRGEIAALDGPKVLRDLRVHLGR
jgi:hypothetical protein